MTMWMVRAGRNAIFVNEFLEKELVAIGWPAIGEVEPGVPKEDIARLLINSPGADGNQHRASTWASQIWRFLNEITVGDQVITYDPGRRVYAMGEVVSESSFSSVIEDLPRERKVRWETEVLRDSLSTTAKNSLGAISTLFMVPENVATEMKAIAGGETPQSPASDLETEDAVGSFEQTRDESRELIKDRISRLDGYELQDLVAGVLRAMGYKTRVSPPGADRGIDILASPDGFGFEQPRIIVECKHRPGTAMGAQEIRKFLGGRSQANVGLFVSTGGFSKEAKYEAERSSIPLTLMDLDQLVTAIVDHYEKVDSEIQVLLPLAKLYWPVD